MKLKDLVLQKHSKQQTMKIVRYVGDDKRRFSEMIRLFIKGDNLVRQRIAWSLSYSAEAHPELVQSHLKKLLKNLKRQDLHDAEKRNTVRLLQNIDLPAGLRGLAAGVLFPLVSSANEPVAVKCFAMTALARICKLHPELSRELKLVLEAQLPHATAEFRARAKRTFKELNFA